MFFLKHHGLFFIRYRENAVFMLKTTITPSLHLNRNTATWKNYPKQKQQIRQEAVALILRISSIAFPDRKNFTHITNRS